MSERLNYIAGTNQICYKDSQENIILQDIESFVNQFFTNVDSTGTISIIDDIHVYTVYTCTPNGKIEQTSVTSVERIQLPENSSLYSLTMNSGRIVTTCHDAGLISRVNNTFAHVPITDITTDIPLPVSRITPSRIVNKDITSLIDVKMTTNAPDLQSVVPIQTDTWGYLQLTYQNIPLFLEVAQTDRDIATLRNILNVEDVNYIFVHSTDAIESGNIMVYKITTPTGNFMLSNGLFVTL